MIGTGTRGQLEEVLRRFCSDRAFREETVSQPQRTFRILSRREARCFKLILRRYAGAREMLEAGMRYPLATSVEAYLVARR